MSKLGFYLRLSVLFFITSASALHAGPKFPADYADQRKNYFNDADINNFILDYVKKNAANMSKEELSAVRSDLISSWLRMNRGNTVQSVWAKANGQPGPRIWWPIKAVVPIVASSGLALYLLPKLLPHIEGAAHSVAQMGVPAKVALSLVTLYAAGTVLDGVRAAIKDGIPQSPKGVKWACVKGVLAVAGAVAGAGGAAALHSAGVF